MRTLQTRVRRLEHDLDGRIEAEMQRLGVVAVDVRPPLTVVLHHDDGTATTLSLDPNRPEREHGT